jgi:hypothetical protein
MYVSYIHAFISHIEAEGLMQYLARPQAIFFLLKARLE